MDKVLDKNLDEIMNTVDVTGVVCCDTTGLCLNAKGNSPRDTAGIITSLAQQAVALHPEIKETPIVCIETDTVKTVIRSQDGVTLGINKRPG